MSDLPVVCIFGAENISLKSAGPIPHFETDEMDCRCYKTDDNLYEVLAKDRPVAIVTFGDYQKFRKINEAPFCVKRMWVNFQDIGNLSASGVHTFECLLHNMIAPKQDVPLVTVFTPAYKSGDKIMKPYHSLVNQTYKDWEWIIMDDSQDDKTFAQLTELAKRDFRIRVYKSSRHSGVIGNVKREACDLGRGEFLLELDHDDELTPDALELVVKAYREHPEVGFIYSDCAECYEDGTPVSYNAGWGLGYGSYRDEMRNGILYKVINSPNINDFTIRHIVAAPNHLRSWRKKVYDEIGGHNPLIHVADDYCLMVKTFLKTRMLLIKKLLYVQYRNQTGNTSQLRNKEIQRLVRYISMFYDQQIHIRLLELGVADTVWKEGVPSFYRLNIPHPVVESNCTITYDPSK